MESFFEAGKTDTSADLVRGFFGDFPNVRICAGWIPQVFATLPDRDWAFVHLDLTLYEPTLAALEYFYPALTRAARSCVTARFSVPVRGLRGMNSAAGTISDLPAWVIASRLSSRIDLNRQDARKPAQASAAP